MQWINFGGSKPMSGGNWLDPFSQYSGLLPKLETVILAIRMNCIKVVDSPKRAEWHHHVFSSVHVNIEPPSSKLIRPALEFENKVFRVSQADLRSLGTPFSNSQFTRPGVHKVHRECTTTWALQVLGLPSHPGGAQRQRGFPIYCLKNHMVTGVDSNP